MKIKFQAIDSIAGITMRTTIYDLPYMIYHGGHLYGRVLFKIPFYSSTDFTRFLNTK